MGNRIASDENGKPSEYRYDVNDRLLQLGDKAFRYDANGNTVAVTDTTQSLAYRYNLADRMIEADATVAGVTVSSHYQYDADGLRRNRSNDHGTTRFITDANRNYTQVVAESDGSTVMVRYHHSDDLLSRQRGTMLRYYHHDGLGSTRKLSDSSGMETDAYQYDGYGNLLSTQGTTQNDFLFTGEPFDKALDQYYLRARYYDPATGRFTQMDPFEGKRSFKTVIAI